MEIPEWNDEEAKAAIVTEEEEEKVEIDENDTGDEEFKTMLSGKRLVIDKYTGQPVEVDNLEREKQVRDISEDIKNKMMKLI